MSTDLYAITNAGLAGNETKEHIDCIMERLKALKLIRTTVFRKGKSVEREGDWNYHIDEDYEPFVVWTKGPYIFTPCICHHVTYIPSIYKYSYLYNLEEFNVEIFRNELFQVVNALGGTEVIFVADNACDKLNGFLAMAWEDVPYDEIKREMISTFGQPITDYSQLKGRDLSYRSINEFVMDDFKDLREICD